MNHTVGAHVLRAQVLTSRGHGADTPHLASVYRGALVCHSFGMDSAQDCASRGVRAEESNIPHRPAGHSDVLQAESERSYWGIDSCS